MAVLSQDSESLSATDGFEEHWSQRLGYLYWSGSQLELNAIGFSQDLVSVSWATRDTGWP
ncbi:hypothetical protein [Streptomyces sp. NBC_01429]|uniref:hypothetical protein n=1 Tax=Streptomyces sp. NBC_01429 TaxID=2903862 RepID=UPI002E2C99E3|nr:hypothetical protein [Streptomyces sp. NBC_01429]